MYVDGWIDWQIDRCSLCDVYTHISIHSQIALFVSILIVFIPYHHASSRSLLSGVVVSVQFNGITYFTFENSTDQYQRECDEDERTDEEENRAREGRTNANDIVLVRGNFFHVTRIIFDCPRQEERLSEGMGRRSHYWSIISRESIYDRKLAYSRIDRAESIKIE